MDAPWSVVDREPTVAERLERLEADCERLAGIADDLARALGRSAERARRAHARALVREYKAACPDSWLDELVSSLAAWRECRGGSPPPAPMVSGPDYYWPSEASVREFLRGVIPGGGDAADRAMLEFGAAALSMSLDDHEDFALWDQMPALETVLDLDLDPAVSKGPGENPAV